VVGVALAGGGVLAIAAPDGLDALRPRLIG
jgi:hypothetical protein